MKNKFRIEQFRGCCPESIGDAFEIAKGSSYGWTRASMIKALENDSNSWYFEITINNGAWGFKIILEQTK
jgi:hypothetical protein